MEGSLIEDICDQCQGEASVFCEDCQNSYCTDCSRVRHKVGKRKEHHLTRISVIPNITYVSLDEEVGSTYRGTVS